MASGPSSMVERNKSYSLHPWVKIPEALVPGPQALVVVIAKIKPLSSAALILRRAVAVGPVVVGLWGHEPLGSGRVRDWALLVGGTVEMREVTLLTLMVPFRATVGWRPQKKYRQKFGFLSVLCMQV